MITLTLDDREVRDALHRLERRLADMSPVMRAVAIEMEKRVSDRFEAERDPQGRPWRPLSKKTLARKKRRKNILYDQGDMLGSLNSRYGRDYAEVGFGQPYAVFHEFGTRRMPRRGLLMGNPEARTLGDADREAVLKILAEALGRSI